MRLKTWCSLPVETRLRQLRHAGSDLASTWLLLLQKSVSIADVFLASNPSIPAVPWRVHFSKNRLLDKSAHALHHSSQAQTWLTQPQPLLRPACYQHPLYQHPFNIVLKTSQFGLRRSDLYFCVLLSRPGYINETLRSLAALDGLSRVTVYVSQDGSNSAVSHVVNDNAASLGKPHSKGFEHWQRPRVPALGDKQVGSPAHAGCHY